MAESRANFIERVSIEYLLDDPSLTKALARAQADWLKAHKHAKAFSEKESKAQMDKLVAYNKLTNTKIEQENRRSAKKIAAEEIKENKKAQARILKDTKKRIADEERAEKKAASQKASSQKKSFSGGFSNFGGKIGTISSYGAAIAVINSVRQAITFAVTKAIEFEVAFTDLSVKAGFSANEMAKVSESIYSVAESTQFSTLEIVGAATALGKLGFEANEVVEILPNVANVASATGESLQNTAEILGKVTRAYEYTAEQSGIISDRMVDIFNNSALNLEKFNTAFSYVGSAAASTGTSFNELTAAMAILSDRGITASKIGTGLRNVFTKLGKEGDSLRDILQRVNEEHLSFYEVAELVGRRAANQLFIMANSLDEFDANVARSMDDYGSALKAAANQMDTFEGKWKIFVNTLTNKVAAPEFDPDTKFQDALSDSIDLMDTWNAIWSKSAADQTIARTIAQYPEFAKDFEKLRDSLSEDEWGSVSDGTVLNEMAENLIKASKEMEKGGLEWRRATDYAYSLKDLRNILLSSSDEDGITNKILDNEVERAENFALKAVEKWNTTLSQTFKKAQSYGGSEVQTEFIKQFFKGDPSKSLDLLKEISDDIVSEEDANILLGGLRNRTDKLFSSFLLASDEKLIDRLADQYKTAKTYVRTINKDADEFTKNSIADDKALIKEAIASREAIAKEICDLYPSLATKLGIICDTSSGRKKKGEIGQFEKNFVEEEEYKRKKDLLTKQYGAEDDPKQKIILNNQLYSLEKQYRDKLLIQYNEYLEKQESLRAAFVKRYPEQAKEFDDNSTRVSRDKERDITSGEKNKNTYDNRRLEAQSEAYKRSVELKAQYNFDISKLDLQLRETERKDIDTRKKLLDERNKISDKYFADEEANLDLLVSVMVLKLAEVEEINKDIGEAILKGDKRVSSSSLLDTDKLKSEIATLKTEILKLRTDRNDAQKSSGNINGDPELTTDWEELINNAYDSTTDLYNQIGDLKLEAIKEQNARELEEIQKRFDEETNIVQASLTAGIVSQEQATEAEERLRRKKIDKENAANKKLFDAQKKRDKESAIIDGISATAAAIVKIFAQTGNPIASGILAGISAAAIAASTSVQVGAIGRRKFVPQKYAKGGVIEGGVIQGRSHAQGGVPFTVSGHSGFEAEGGEFIVNKEATRNNLAELQRINGKTKNSKRKFATGGIVNVEQDASNINDAILEALSRPVRAFVTDQDLANSESERLALSKKTSF